MVIPVESQKETRAQSRTTGPDAASTTATRSRRTSGEFVMSISPTSTATTQPPDSALLTNSSLIAASQPNTQLRETLTEGPQETAGDSDRPLVLTRAEI